MGNVRQAWSGLTVSMGRVLELNGECAMNNGSLANIWNVFLTLDVMQLNLDCDCVV